MLACATPFGMFCLLFCTPCKWQRRSLPLHKAMRLIASPLLTCLFHGLAQHVGYRCPIKPLTEPEERACFFVFAASMLCCACLKKLAVIHDREASGAIFPARRFIAKSSTFGAPRKQ